MIEISILRTPVDFFKRSKSLKGETEGVSHCLQDFDPEKIWLAILSTSAMLVDNIQGCT